MKMEINSDYEKVWEVGKRLQKVEESVTQMGGKLGRGEFLMWTLCEKSPNLLIGMVSVCMFVPITSMLQHPEEGDSYFPRPIKRKLFTVRISDNEAVIFISDHSVLDEEFARDIFENLFPVNQP